MRLLLVYLFLCITFIAGAQPSLPNLDSIAHGEVLPDKLLSSKALLVFNTLPNPRNPDLRIEWLPLADELQPLLQKSGIDAVAAYHLGDIFSGKETSEAFMFQFKERAISHLVVVEQEPNGYRIHIGQFNEETFIDKSVPMWSTFGADLYQAGSNLYLASSQSGQKLTNRLILAVPEIGDLVNPIKGRRSEFYDLNLESDKLAIVPFADTAAINRVMENYPYKYDFVDPSIPERNLRSDGYQFILYFVNSTGESVRKMLEYPVDQSVGAYVSESFQGETPVAQNFDKNRPVFKFYVKHIYSGNVFLGQKYDAAPTWQEALSYYIANLREELL